MNSLGFALFLTSAEEVKEAVSLWTFRFSGKRRSLCFLAAIAATTRDRGACPTVSRHDELGSREAAPRRGDAVSRLLHSISELSAGLAPHLRTVAVTPLHG